MFGKEPSKEIAIATPMELISEAIRKDLDPDKLEKLMTLQERWVANQAKQSYRAALAGFQGDCPLIPCTKKVKGRKGFFYSYAPLDKIQQLVKPFLKEWGLSITFSTKLHSDGYITAFCTVSHINGHSEVSEFTCPVDPDMDVNNSQKMGSANSYAKRYALGNALNLAFEREDDDGNSAVDAFITEDQVANIEALLTEVSADQSAMLEWIGAESIETIRAEKYKEVITELEGRR